jgi:hypothetical protein
MARMPNKPEKHFPKKSSPPACLKSSQRLLSWLRVRSSRQPRRKIRKIARPIPDFLLAPFLYGVEKLPAFASSDPIIVLSNMFEGSQTQKKGFGK